MSRGDPPSPEIAKMVSGAKVRGNVRKTRIKSIEAVVNAYKNGVGAAYCMYQIVKIMESKDGKA